MLLKIEDRLILCLSDQLLLTNGFSVENKREVFVVCKSFHNSPLIQMLFVLSI